MSATLSSTVMEISVVRSTLAMHSRPLVPWQPQHSRHPATHLIASPTTPSSWALRAATAPSSPSAASDFATSGATLATVRSSGHTASAPSRFSQAEYDGFLTGYRSQYTEHDYWIDESMVEGTIPKDLEGTLLRNGPGLFEVGGKQIPMPLDGDGMICSFAFKDGRVFFRNRYVRTEALLQERAAGRMLYRGAFSVGNPSGGWLYNPLDFSVKGIANTGVLHWGGKLLALYERDLPYELNPDLTTIGRTNLDGTVDTEKLYFGAHYRITNEKDGSQRLVAFNFSEEGAFGRVHFWEYTEAFQMLHKTRFDIPGASFGFIHDILVTDNYYVILENPIQMDFGTLLTKYMLGKACLAECLKFNHLANTRVHVLPRPGRTSPVGITRQTAFDTTPFFAFHHVNAFEAEAGRMLVVDTCAMNHGIDFSNSFDTGRKVFDGAEGKADLTRLVVDLQTGKVKRITAVDNRYAELPVVAPSAVGKPHSHAYLAVARVVGDQHWGPTQAVGKYTMSPSLGVATPFSRAELSEDIYDPGEHSFASEPIFVPRPGGMREDDGWVLVVVYRAVSQTSDLVILDAVCLAEGPVATIRLPHHIPLGIHGSFTPTFLGPAMPSNGSIPAERVHHMYNIKQGVGHPDGTSLKYS